MIPSLFSNPVWRGRARQTRLEKRRLGGGWRFSWKVEHHHGPIGDPNNKPPGNGVLLWFQIDDIDAAIARAKEMRVEVILPRHRNPPDGDSGPNHWEIWLRDPDGYKVVLASPDGTADGNWKP